MSNELLIVLKALDKASGPVKQVESSLGSLESSSRGLVDRGLSPLQNILGTGLKVAAGAAVAALGGVTAAIGAGVKSAIGMEQQVADIAAVMNTTSGEIAPLKDLIKELGVDPNLKVSATEAADAIQMLARNGLSMQQILDGAAKSTVLMANATGADFGTAADIATDAMSLFNISVEDMESAVSGVSSVLTNSKFGIDDYRLALANAGGMAKTIGLGFDDFNTTIASVAPFFASGSDAGTGFKTFLQRLTPATSAAADEMARLGLLTESGSSVFFDAAGNLKDMGTIIGLLNRATANLSAEQRSQAFTTIFGSDAMRIAAAMADQTEESFRALQSAMGQTDAAEMAKTRVDTLAGAIEILSSVIEGIGLEIGEAFLPVFRSIVEAFTTFISEHSGKIIEWFGNLAGWLAKIVEQWLPPLVTWIGNAFNAIIEFGKTIFEFLSGDGDALRKWVEGLPEPWNQVGAAVLAVVEAIGSFASFMSNNVIMPSFDWIKQFVSLTDVLAGIGIVIAWSASRSIVAALRALVVAWGPVGLILAGAIGAVALIRNAWENDWWNIREHFRTVAEYLDSRFGLLLKTIRDFGGGALEEIWKFVTGNDTEFTNLRAIWDLTKLTARVLFDDLTRFVKDNWPIWRDRLAEWGTTAWQWIKDATPVALRKVGEWGGAIWKWVTDNFPVWKSKVGGWAQGLWEWISEAMPKVLSTLWDWLKGMFKWLGEKAPEWDQAIGKFMVGAFEFVGKVVPQAIHKLGDLLVGLMKWSSTTAVEGFKAGLEGLANATEASGDDVQSAFLRAFGNILVAIVEVAIQIGTAFLFWLGQSILSWAGLDIDLWKLFDHISLVLNNWRLWDLAVSIWNKFKSGTQDTLTGPVVRAFEAGWVALVRAFNSGVSSFREHVFEPAKSIYIRVSDAIKSVNLTTAFNDIWVALVRAFNSARQSFWEHVWNPTRSIVERIAGALKDVNLGDNFNVRWAELVRRFNTEKDSFWNHVWTPTRNIMVRVAHALRDVNLGDNFQLPWNGLVNRFNTEKESLWRHVWTPTRDIMVRIAHALRDVNLADNFWAYAWNPLVTEFNTLTSQLWTHVWEPMRNIGKRIVDGLTGGLQEKWRDITNWFNNLGASIPQWVRDALGIRSPSTVFVEIAKQIMQGLQFGVEEFAKLPEVALQGAVGGMAASAAAAANNTVNNVRTNNINVTIPNAAPIDDPDSAIRRYNNLLSSIYT